MAGSAAAQSSVAGGQAPPVTPPPLIHLEAPAGAPVTLTLQDALQRASVNEAQLQATAAEAASATEERAQAKAGLLPAFTFTTQYIGNQPSPNPTGRFVSMDGVNMYRVWGVAHQDLSPGTFMRTPLRRAQAAELQAQAALEVAQRGLAVTVTRDYYAVITSGRKYATAQQAAQQAARIFEIARQQEQAGQIARADVIKADIQFRQQQQAFREAALVLDTARLGLAVLVFPDFTENFTVVDDMASAPALPPFADIRMMAERDNPDLRAANAALEAAAYDVRGARNALLPSFVVEGVYGIEANEFALHSVYVAQPELGVLPNLGYMVSLNLSVPLWDWGGLRSKVRQSEIRQRQSRVHLSYTQRQLVSNLYSEYNEALTAREAVNDLRQVADLATESLRLTTLRYQAGESSSLEIVDAQNTLVQARNASDDAEARYRVAIAQLQTVTGRF
jgi:outer membrane protein TolC